MKVKDTYLAEVKHGDIGMHRSKGILAGDVLGDIIVLGEGNRGRDENDDGIKEPGRSSGDYTHCFLVTQPPDPEAEVEVVGKDQAGRDIYNVKDKSKAGLKCHATWPCIKEEPINWTESHFQLWRVRSIAKEYNKTGQIPAVVYRMVKWARDRRGRVYNWLQFITLGLIQFPNSWVCSHFIFDCAFESSQHEPEPIILSPDGMFDQLATPNDLINSLKMIRVRYTGSKAA